MLTTLIESRRRSRRSTGSTTASIIAHATLIILATAATARGSDDTPASLPPSPVVTYFAVAETPPARGNTAAPSTPTDDAPRLPTPPVRQIDLPVDIPTTVPPLDLSRLASDPSDFVIGERTTSGPIGADAPASNGQGGTYAGWQVEKGATPLTGNPRPHYPSLLQSAQVDGEVLAQFVVDSSGLVDMATFRAIRTTDELFTEAVKRVLVRWKFQPAEVGGRKVRQLVQMPLTFRVR
jgi:protein TonB